MNSTLKVNLFAKMFMAKVKNQESKFKEDKCDPLPKNENKPPL